MSAESYLSTQRIPIVRLLALHARANPAIKELNQTITILGAGEGADLILESGRVGAAHTALVALPMGTYVRDLGAPGGTLLRGRRVRWSPLTDGDELAIGPFSLRVQLDGSIDDTPTDIPVFRVRNEKTIGTIVSNDAALIIGSDSGCDVVLTDPSIAPRHALVVWTRRGAMVRDLTGRSSVRRNDRLIQMGVLRDGDAIGIGPYELIFELQAASSAAEPTDRADSELEEEQANTPRVWLDGSQVRFVSAETEDETSSSDLEDRFGDSSGEVEADGDRAEADFQDVLESRSAFVEQFPPQFRERIAAAQRALDERAQRLRRDLEAERTQLKSYQEKLQEQARQLLEATRQNQQQQSDRPTTVGVPTDGMPSNEPIEPAILSDRSAADASDRTDEPPSDHASSLQERVSELVRMVRDEKEEMNRAENRLESMRFDIDRLRGSVLRAKEKHRVQEAEHESRYADLKRGQTVLGQEREALLARIRRLESRESALAARIQEADQMRKELDGESDRLNRAQEEHDERLRELRTNLEGERHRLRIRHAELQRKAADLAKLAGARRKAIEEIITRQHSQLREKESELRAKQTAVSEAGRAELEQAASDLEKLLSSRLAEVETEVLSRQEKLDNWLKSIWDTAKPMTETPDSTARAGHRFEPFVSRMPANGQSAAGERGKMALLEKELRGLHRAVRRLEEDSDQRCVWRDVEAAPQGGKVDTYADRPAHSVHPSNFSERIASIRRGLMDLGTLESRNPAPPPEKSVGIEF